MRLSAILLLTVGFWANFLCCCQGERNGHCAATAVEESQTTECGMAMGMGAHCDKAPAKKSHCQNESNETVAVKGPVAKTPCQCQKHRLDLTAVIMVTKGETQIPTAPLNLFLQPWTYRGIPNLHDVSDFPESFRAPPDTRGCPSLSALSRFLI